MIELLSRMDASTSGFIAQKLHSGEDKSKKANRNQQCPTCRGRKRVRMPAVEVGQSVTFEACPRCQGTGKRLESHATATRPKGAPDMMTAEQLGFAVAGMPPHLFRAAMVLVTHDERARRLLVDDVVERLTGPRSAAWGVSDSVRPIRALGIARVATVNLRLPEGYHVDGAVAANLMCCHTPDWRRTWSDRAEDVTLKLRQWTGQADRYMVERREAGRTQSDAA